VQWWNRDRFDSETIKKMLHVQWWNRDRNWIKDNADLFLSVDFENKSKFEAKWEKL
jgi:hypothetical protein